MHLPKVTRGLHLERLPSIVKKSNYLLLHRVISQKNPFKFKKIVVGYYITT